MCAWKPGRIALGELPNVSFIVRKLEPMCTILNNIKIMAYGNKFLLHLSFLIIIGTEFKTIAFPVSGVMHHVEVQCGKEGMKAAKFKNIWEPLLAVLLDYF
jgi:hypothetical protein